jgi:CheY-like chemotaxis protein
LVLWPTIAKSSYELNIVSGFLRYLKTAGCTLTFLWTLVKISLTGRFQMPTTKNCQSILVVEDDADIRATVVDILETEGYHTLAAANGKEALDILATIPKPCLVLLDMMMPIMNGRQFLDELMSNANLAPIPVMIVSAIGDRTDTRGSVGFLKKPVDLEVILKVVSQYCN